MNSLPPYATPSSYFEAGDEPFDGKFAGGADVAAAFTDEHNPVWASGTWQSEVSLFLVDANAGGDPHEQLAQQLLAFIFNTRHRLDDPGAVIVLPNGSTASAQSVIDSAVAAWMAPSSEGCVFWQGILDTMNNNNAVGYVRYSPCPVVYAD